MVAFKTTQTLLNNLHKNMDEEKYFSIFKSNKAIASRLLVCPSAVDILLAVNFVDIGDRYQLDRPSSIEESLRVYHFITFRNLLFSHLLSQNIIKFAHECLSKMIETVENSQMIEPSGELVCF